MPGQSGQNCKGDDEPGHSIIDNTTHSLPTLDAGALKNCPTQSLCTEIIHAYILSRASEVGSPTNTLGSGQ